MNPNTKHQDYDSKTKKETKTPRYTHYRIVLHNTAILNQCSSTSCLVAITMTSKLRM